MNVALLYGRYFEFVRDPAWPAASALPELLYEYEMLIERELCLYFTAFLITVNNPLRSKFNHFFTPKELNNREIIDANIQLGVLS